MNKNHNKIIIFRDVDGKQRPFIDINYVSEIIGVPKDVLIYHISENKDLVSLRDYVNCARVTARHINLRTIIYLMQVFKKDIGLWEKVIETMYESTVIDTYEDKYNELCQSLLTLCNTHNISTSINEEDEIDNIENVDSESTKVTKKAKYYKNSKLLPTLTEDEMNWQKDAIEKTKEKAAKLDSTLSGTLRRIYGRMTNVYGIVFDQEKKDIKNMFNIDEEEHMSTLYVITVSEQLRSLFDGILADL